MKTQIKNINSLEFTPYEIASLEDLLSNGKSFCDSETFKDKDFTKKLLDYKGPDINTDWFFNHLNNVDGIHSGKTFEKEILSSEEERLLFLKYNYLKKKINIMAKLNVPESYSAMLSLNNEANKVKEQIISANLSLVLSLSESNSFKHLDSSEALGEGNAALINAVENFNIDKGHKFSTYCTTVITRSFIKASNSNKKHKAKTVEFNSESHDQAVEDRADTEILDLINRFLNKDNKILSEDEKFVLRKKYFDDLTLEEIGKFYDPIKTKGQIFYIEKNAREKLRSYLVKLM